MERTILHIDFDSFFASVEQQNNPQFRGKPLGVTATNGRTCIIAASREAKRLGVKSPSRTFEAQRICPTLLLTGSHFTQYWEISKKFISICKDFSPFVEVFSLDELFMDITKTSHLFGGTTRLIEQIIERIRMEIGEYITVSIGISYNKLLAKLASGLRKPNGIVRIDRNGVEKIYGEAKLTDICGIGNRIAIRLASMGITDLNRLRHATLPSLIAEFGNVEGRFLKNVGLGVDESPVVPYTQAPEAKSVGRNYCLARNEYNSRKVLQHIYELSEEIGIKLRRLHMKARYVGISLRGASNVHGGKTFHYYFDSGSDIFRNGIALIDPEFLKTNYVRQISIWAGLLRNSDTVPYDLFNEQKRKEKIVAVTDKINERFGDHTIRNGFLLYSDKLTTVPNGYGADRYERKLLATEF